MQVVSTIDPWFNSKDRGPGSGCGSLHRASSPAWASGSREHTARQHSTLHSATLSSVHPLSLTLLAFPCACALHLNHILYFKLLTSCYDLHCLPPPFLLLLALQGAKCAIPLSTTE